MFWITNLLIAITVKSKLQVRTNSSEPSKTDITLWHKSQYQLHLTYERWQR